MKKWIADFEVDSHLAVANNDLKLKFCHPKNLYEIHLRNSPTTVSDAYPLLSVQVIFECQRIDETKKLAEQYLRIFLDLMTFVTNSKFSIHNLIRVVDWTPGLAMRECYQFKKFKEIDSPFPYLEEEYLRTVGVFLEGEISPSLRRTLRWFSRAISSTLLDDQFQYFWFVIELLSEIHKKTEKIPDKCPKCQNSLFCETCNEIPTHKPYPKQAILQLIQKFVKGDPDILFDKLNKIRNALMHGSEIKEIEKTYTLSVEELVNTLGKLSWAAILNSFERPKETTKLNFIDVSKYVHHTLTTWVHMKMGCPDKNDPKIENMPMVQIDMITHDDKNEDIS